MTLVSIAAISGIIPANLMPAVESAGKSGGAGAGSDFGEMLGKALDTVSSSQVKADNLAVQAATGDLAAIHDFTVASTEPSGPASTAPTYPTQNAAKFTVRV